jgi:F subunit of K+-transporting ATPase (Potass_KdpF)
MIADATADNYIGLAVAVAVLVLLIFVLVYPERF